MDPASLVSVTAIATGVVLATGRAIGEAIALSLTTGSVAFVPNPLDGRHVQRARPRKQERGKRQRDENRGKPAPRPARQEEFGELAAGGVTAADDHRLERQAG